MRIEACRSTIIAKLWQSGKLYRSRFFIAPIPMRLILEDLSGLTRAGFGVLAWIGGESGLWMLRRSLDLFTGDEEVAE